MLVSDSDVARECILDALAEHGQLSLSTLIEVECKDINRNVTERTLHKLQSLGKVRRDPCNSKWELVPGDRQTAPKHVEPSVIAEETSDRQPEPATCELPDVPSETPSEAPNPFEDDTYMVSEDAEPRTIEDVARRVAEKPPRDVLTDAADLGLRVSFELEQARAQREKACAEVGRLKAELVMAQAAEEEARLQLDSLLQRETKLERLAEALAGAVAK